MDTAVANWGADGLFFTEAGRGGPLPWRVGQANLEGDALGPVRHAHDGAAEYYYMFSGSALVEVGGHESVMQEGELGYIPPDAPHNFLGPASNVDACLFCIVSPNFVTNKWRIRDFLPDTDNLRLSVGRLFADDSLPGGGALSAHAIALESGDPARVVTPEGEELIYVVVQGALDVALFGGLHGTLERGTYLHVRNGVRHELSTESSCQALRMHCGFRAWEGVALGEPSA